MSAASRLAQAETRIVPPKDPQTGKFMKRPTPSQIGGSIARNSARVAGGIAAVPLPAPIVVAGQRWDPDDALPHRVSIGYALAVEMAEGVSA